MIVEDFGVTDDRGSHKISGLPGDPYTPSCTHRMVKMHCVGTCRHKKGVRASHAVNEACLVRKDVNDKLIGRCGG